LMKPPTRSTPCVNIRGIEIPQARAHVRSSLPIFCANFLGLCDLHREPCMPQSNEPITGDDGLQTRKLFLGVGTHITAEVERSPRTRADGQ